MSDNPVRPRIVRATEMQTTEHPRITTSTEFRAFIEQKRTEATRRREDLMTEVTRLETEIDVRHIEIGAEDYIIQSCEAALTIELVAVTK